ncbi:unnamed protein product [Urochloa humidicola]
MASSSRRCSGERAAGNLEHLVRAVLERGRGRPSAVSSGRGVGGLGLTTIVPASLGRTTNIEHILQAADNVEDPKVPRIRGASKKAVVVMGQGFSSRFGRVYMEASAAMT